MHTEHLVDNLLACTMYRLNILFNLEHGPVFAVVFRPWLIGYGVHLCIPGTTWCQDQDKDELEKNDLIMPHDVLIKIPPFK